MEIRKKKDKTKHKTVVFSIADIDENVVKIINNEYLVARNEEGHIEVSYIEDDADSTIKMLKDEKMLKDDIEVIRENVEVKYT